MLAIALFIIVFTMLCCFTHTTNEDYCYVTPPNGVDMLDWLDEVALYIELKSSALEGEVL